MKLNGPGKYDDQCMSVMVSTNAVGVMVLVVDGERGNGVSFKTIEPDLLRVMPAMLEQIAAQLRADAQSSAN